MSVIKVNNITNRDGTTGPVIAGITTVSSTSHLVVPTGSTGQRVALAPDPYINNLVLALPFNSESVFSDLSPKGNQPMPTGIGTTTASLPFGVSGVTTTSSGIVTFSKYYGTSAYFDGSGDYLTTSSTDSFNLRTNLFTIEFFTYPNSTNHVSWVVSGTDTSFYIETYLTSGVFIGDGTQNIINVTAPPTGKWTHMALTFDGTTYRLFYDGVLQGSSTTLLTNTTLSSFRIGARYDGTRPFDGYIQDLRIYKGVAKYTSTFTPPNQIAL